MKTLGRFVRDLAIEAWTHPVLVLGVAAVLVVWCVGGLMSGRDDPYGGEE